MFEVIYYSMTGNTKKVAEVIAEELNATAENVKGKKELGKDSFVLLGSGCYGGRPWRELQKFILNNDFKGKKVALFGTSANGSGDEVKAMEELLKPTGAIIMGKFSCKGKYFFFFNRKYPSEKNLSDAREFAKKMKEN
ncbi:MAG: flavodoxin family protein [Dehalococcoidales bacterium]|nr:flavodoxin family protein [Dehalococcoidales bacterium]